MKSAILQHELAGGGGKDMVARRLYNMLINRLRGGWGRNCTMMKEEDVCNDAVALETGGKKCSWVDGKCVAPPKVGKKKVKKGKKSRCKDVEKETVCKAREECKWWEKEEGWVDGKCTSSNVVDVDYDGNDKEWTLWKEPSSSSSSEETSKR